MSNRRVVVILSGGLGNQLFQYSYGYSVAKRLNRHLYVDVGDLKKSWHRAPMIGNILGNSVRYVSMRRVERQGSFVVREGGNDMNLESIGDKDILINGYFQSESHFSDYEEEIRSHITDGGRRLQKRGAVVLGIHVRKSDYIKRVETNAKYGEICDVEYYRNAVRHAYRIRRIEECEVFSDDLDWVEENLSDILPPRARITGKRDTMHSLLYNSWFARNMLYYRKYSSVARDIQDFYLLSSCSHFIISNSTYSWWASWLGSAEDKLICVPRVWSIEGGTEKLSAELYQNCHTVTI